MDNLHVITGGPGAGKTALIEALAATGLPVMPEAGRAIIRAQQTIDGPALPWRDPARFAEAMLVWEMRSHAEAVRTRTPVLFDRGLPDVAGYLRLEGLAVPDHVSAAVRHIRYAPRVFLAPHWPQIYSRDTERRQDAAEAERTCRMMADVYSAAGYAIVELPRASVSERVSFVRARIACDPPPAGG